MLSKGAKSAMNKVSHFFEEHKDLQIDLSLVRLYHEERARRLSEQFHQLPIEKQREILALAKENMNNEMEEIDEED